MRSQSPSRRAAPAIVLASGLILALGSMSLVSAAPFTSAADAAAAARFRDIFGLPAAADALAKAAISSTSKAKWGVDLTAAEVADMDARTALQDQLDGVDAIVAANGSRLGGVWLDQRGSQGHGFIVMVPFVASVDDNLLNKIRAAAPVGTAIQPVIVARSAAQLEALSDAAAEATAEDLNVSGVSVAPQDNAVIIHTIDGRLPAAIVGIDGYVVVQEGLESIGCTSSYRCTTRPYRGGMEIQDQFGVSGAYGWEECTSAFTVKKPSNGLWYLLTAAHCQIDYNNNTVFTMNTANTTIEPYGYWSSDTVPTRSLTCATVCDMNVEAQLIGSLLLPNLTNKNGIVYSSTDKTHAITGASSWSSSWVGRSICAIGVKMNLSCGTINSVGSAMIHMAKEDYTARINKGAYAYLANVPQEGDSGGPVLSGGTAYGFNTAVTTDGTGKLFFSSVSYALTDLSVSLCVTAAC